MKRGYDYYADSLDFWDCELPDLGESEDLMQYVPPPPPLKAADVAGGTVTHLKLPRWGAAELRGTHGTDGKLEGLCHLKSELIEVVANYSGGIPSGRYSVTAYGCTLEGILSYVEKPASFPRVSVGTASRYAELVCDNEVLLRGYFWHVPLFCTQPVYDSAFLLEAAWPPRSKSPDHALAEKIVGARTFPIHLGVGISGLEIAGPINRLIVGRVELTMPAFGTYAGDLFTVAGDKVLLHGGRYLSHLLSLKKHVNAETPLLSRLVGQKAFALPPTTLLMKLSIKDRLELAMPGGSSLSASPNSVALKVGERRVMCSRRAAIVAEKDRWEVFSAFRSEYAYGKVNGETGCFCAELPTRATLIVQIENKLCLAFMKWMYNSTAYYISYEGNGSVTVSTERQTPRIFTVAYDEKRASYTAKSPAGSWLSQISLKSSLKEEDRWDVICKYGTRMYAKVMHDAVGHIYLMQREKTPGYLQAVLVFLRSLVMSQVKDTAEYWCQLFLVAKNVPRASSSVLKL